MAEFFYNDAESMARDLAASIVNDLKNLLVLPGGRSPRRLITELSKCDLDWSRITITTTDERAVDLEDAQSNAGQIARLFAQEGVKIDPVWLGDQDKFAQLAFPADVTVLGMGLDGHVASLFPDQPWLGAGRVIEAKAPQPTQDRMSLSMETLLETKRLILLVPDAEKWALCQRVIAGEADDLPLAELMRRAASKLELHIVGPGQ